MTMQIKELLHTFDYLSDNEQKEFAFEVLRRTSQFVFPELEDNELVSCAENIFLNLDLEERVNE
jgi:hypothetical protein